MTDQSSTSNDDDDEPVRFTIPQPSIEEYLAYDPELDAYYAPGEPTTYDAEAARRKLQKTIEEVRCEPPIPPEQLRVPAGALDVPAERRKSLGGKRDPLQGTLFSDSLEDDDTGPEERTSTPPDPDGDAPADERP